MLTTLATSRVRQQIGAVNPVMPFVAEIIASPRVRSTAVDSTFAFELKTVGYEPV